MRRLSLLLLVLLLAGAAAALADRPPLAAVPIDRLALPFWARRHEAKLAEAKREPVDLVLLGDFITESYERTGPEPFRDFRAVWQRFYGWRHALNLGFSGDATSHLLWRIEHGEIDGIHPKAAVLLIGANNLGALHWPAADDVRGIETVIAEVHRRLPETQIVLLGVLPSDRGPWVRQSREAINAALAARYGGGAVPYVVYRDVSPLFLLPNGAINTSLYYDPMEQVPHPSLHPSPDGQARMAAAIEPALCKILGDCRNLH